MAGQYPHGWKKRKLFPWSLCKHCGLIALNNEATRRAMRRPCPGLLPD